MTNLNYEIEKDGKNETVHLRRFNKYVINLRKYFTDCIFKSRITIGNVAEDMILARLELPPYTQTWLIARMKRILATPDSIP